VGEASVALDQKYPEIFNATTDGIVVHDAETGQVLDVNRAMLDLYGLTYEEVVTPPGYRPPPFLPPYSAADAYRWVRKAREEGPQAFEWKSSRKNGEVFWVEVTLKCARIGGHDRVLAIVRDITARRRTEEQLRESEARYRGLFEDSVAAISQALPGGRLLCVNMAYARLYGYESPDEMMREVANVGKLYASPADRREVLRILAEEGAMEPREFAVFRRDGSRLVVLVSAKAIKDPEGKLLYYQATHVDITGHKQAEEAMRVSGEQLRALAGRLQAVREEERTRIAREIHDVLAQDLTRLKIDLAWLHGRLAKPGLPGAPEALVDRISEMTGIADAAIHSVQMIATELRPAVLDSLGLCAAVEWQARDFQEHTGIQCRSNLPEAEPPVSHAAATAVFRIVQESLTNVLRHARATQVDIILRQDVDQLVLKVRDNGCGIRPETLSNPLSIGLTGMRERALLLGGHCEIRSEPGEGATVDVRLPLPRSENP